MYFYVYHFYVSNAADENIWMPPEKGFVPLSYVSIALIMDW
jgi:hypothetical protein